MVVHKINWYKTLIVNTESIYVWSIYYEYCNIIFRNTKLYVYFNNNNKKKKSKVLILINIL